MLVLVLSDSVLCLELVVLHGLGVVQVHVLGVEHVRAEVQHGPLVDLGGLVLGGVDLGVVLDEFADSVYEVAVLFLGFEVLLFGEVGEADEEVHED